MSIIGVTIIGRNEGERLRRCLGSLASSSAAIVYVDSGSSDGSLELAKSLGADVVTLSADKPFTAARGRNAGFQRLLSIVPQVEFVQFIDGDCEIDPRWMKHGAEALRATPDVAAVCGRRRERFPDASIYNRLCDLEWNTPIGEVTECGGDAMFRVEPLREAGGYRESLIAGEEPELCVRLRAAGWKILRIDAEMTLHDAAMTRFAQWWKRNVRNGHAFAEGAFLHGKSPARHWVRQVRSNWAWGAALPAIALAMAWHTRGLSLLIAAALFGLLALKIFRHGRQRGNGRRAAAEYALFCAIGKIPQACGQLQFHVGRILGRRQSLIEYKSPLPA